MLNSMLKREKQSIIINKIIFKDINGQEIFNMEKTVVKSLVVKYFENTVRPPYSHSHSSL